jgi:hypothetical protein
MSLFASAKALTVEGVEKFCAAGEECPKPLDHCVLKVTRGDTAAR